MMGTVMGESDFAALATAKEKTLKSVEYAPFGTIEESVGFIRLNLAKRCIELSCLPEAREYFGERDDVMVFRCVEGVPGDYPYPTENVSHRVCRFLVNERVRNVEVVREHVRDLVDGTTFEIDVSVVLRTRWRTAFIHRRAWDDELLLVHLDDAPNADALSVLPAGSSTIPKNLDPAEFRIEREVIVP